MIARPGEKEWVAVYAMAPTELRERDEFFQAGSPQAFEAPAACWNGVPVRLGVAPETYVTGVVAPTNAELSDLVARLPGAPVLRGEFVRTCPND